MTFAPCEGKPGNQCPPSPSLTKKTMHQRHLVPQLTRVRSPTPHSTSRACQAPRLDPLAVHSTPWLELELQNSSQLK
eukprot:1156610-Pelagomonas_calceolata.AAC.4